MVPTAAPRPPDRRHVRRAETIEQVVDIAVQVMAEQGVAGLSLGEVARRMGIQPPSLYVYFVSKHALYDAVFARGWREVQGAMTGQKPPAAGTDLATFLLEFGSRFVGWAVEHPVHAQLMTWRPVPGYRPSPEAYQPAVVTLGRGRLVMEQLQTLGLLRGDVSPDELMSAWTVLMSGLMTQQLANAPDEPFAGGSFTALLPQMVSMFCGHYAAPQPPGARPRRSRADRR